jgi:hypothetical protein
MIHDVLRRKTLGRLVQFEIHLKFVNLHIEWI